MYYRAFYLILILLTISLIWTPHVSFASKEEINNDLIRAAHDGQTEKVLDLIKAGADVNVKNNYGHTALFLASFRPDTEIVKALLKAGADVNAKDNHGYTALMAAASAGRTGTVKALIDAKADVNAKDEKNKTALDWAKDHNVKVIKLLKSAGAKENP